MATEEGKGAGGGGKGKFKGKTMGLEDFLENPLPRFDWAAEMQAETERQAALNTRAALPRGTRATDGERPPSLLVSLDDVPTQPPFLARLTNVDYAAEEPDLRRHYQSTLNIAVEAVKIPRDRATGQSRGFCIVKFANREDLITALKNSGVKLGTRELRVEIADQERNKDMASPPNSPPPQEQRPPPQPASQDARYAQQGYQPPPPPQQQQHQGGHPPHHGQHYPRQHRQDRYEHYGGYPSGYHQGYPPAYGNGAAGYQGGGGGGGGGGGYHSRQDGRQEGYGPPRGGPGRGGGFPPHHHHHQSHQQQGMPGSIGGGYRHSEPEPEGPPKERPKLKLLPRSNSEVEAKTEGAAGSGPAKSGASAAIFGQAKPVDTAAKEAEIERKLAEDKRRAAEARAAEAKAAKAEQQQQRPLKVETRRRTSERTLSSGSYTPSSPPQASAAHQHHQPAPPISPPVEPSEQTLAPGAGKAPRGGKSHQSRGGGRGGRGGGGRGRGGGGGGSRHQRRESDSKAPAEKPKPPPKEEAEKKPRPPKEMPKLSSSPPPSFAAKNPFDLLAQMDD